MNYSCFRDSLIGNSDSCTGLTHNPINGVPSARFTCFRRKLQINFNRSETLINMPIHYITATPIFTMLVASTRKEKKKEESSKKCTGSSTTSPNSHHVSASEGVEHLKAESTAEAKESSTDNQSEASSKKNSKRKITRRRPKRRNQPQRKWQKFHLQVLLSPILNNSLKLDLR